MPDTGAQYDIAGIPEARLEQAPVRGQLQKSPNLGPDSLNIVKNMELYNPDKTRRATSDN
jgi:hypothetical protein